MFKAGEEEKRAGKKQCQTEELELRRKFGNKKAIDLFCAQGENKKEENGSSTSQQMLHSGLPAGLSVGQFHLPPQPNPEPR